MRKMVVVGILLWAFSSGVQAQKEGKGPAEEPVSKSDTMLVTVHEAPGENQFRLDFFVTNSEPVAGMPTPVKVTAKDAKMQFDSVSYVEGRVEYFQLKTQNADTANQTLLIGLIADLSGSKPPLKPGRGKALSVYYTSTKAIKPGDVDVDAVILPPANKLEFNTIMADGQVGSTIPTFVHSKGKAVKVKPDK